MTLPASNPKNASNRRSGTPGPTPALKATRTELQEAAGVITDVRNVKDARKVLQGGQYIIPGTHVTTNILSTILLQLSVSTPKPALPLVNAVRAVAFLLDEIAAERTAEAIADAVMAKLKVTLQEIRDATVDIESVTDGLRSSAASNIEAFDGMREDLGELSDKVTQVNHELNDRATPEAAPLPPTIVPPQHATAVTQGNTKSRQLYVQPTPNEEEDPLKDLSEKELVAKANMALDLMGLAASDAPEGTTFVGARRLRTGAIQYQLNLEDAAEWLRDEEVLKSFMEHFGGASIARAQLLYTVAEFVPVTFDPTIEVARENAERSSGLQRGAMVHVKWIKDPRKRKPTQKVAHTIVGFATREAANQAIGQGLYIEGKHISVRKLLPEPKRCLKCQTMGTNHVAANCKSIHDVCANCAGHHRTEQCGLTDHRKFKCSNCQGEEGHGAADRLCPYFRAQLTKFHARIPDTKYKFFPTNEPHTWEMEGSSDLYNNNQDAAWAEGGETQGGWSQVRHSKQRRGAGRLAGGPNGGGGGTTARVDDGGGGTQSRAPTQGGLWGRTAGTRYQAARVPDKGWPAHVKDLTSYFPVIGRLRA